MEAGKCGAASTGEACTSPTANPTAATPAPARIARRDNEGPVIVSSAIGNAHSPARDRRDDADLVAFLHRRIQILQEADVFVIQIDIDEAIELSRRFEQASLDAAGL